MIRVYKPNDFKDICNIYEKVKLQRNKLGDPEYEADIQKAGFLLGLDTPEDIQKEIDKSFATFVYEENEKIIGYLIADHSKDQKYVDDEYKFWFDEKIKKIYYKNPKCMTIATLAVDTVFSKQGIATELLTSLIKELKKHNFKYLFSIVTLAPLTNCPTLIWHTKHDFKRLATARPRKLFNLENYFGLLMYKKI